MKPLSSPSEIGRGGKFVRTFLLSFTSVSLSLYSSSFCSTLGIFNSSSASFPERKRAESLIPLNITNFVRYSSKKKDPPQRRREQLGDDVSFLKQLLNQRVDQMNREIFSGATAFSSSSFLAILEMRDALGRTVTRVQLGTTSPGRLHDNRSGK